MVTGFVQDESNADIKFKIFYIILAPLVAKSTPVCLFDVIADKKCQKRDTFQIRATARLCLLQYRRLTYFAEMQTNHL